MKEFFDNLKADLVLAKHIHPDQSAISYLKLFFLRRVYIAIFLRITLLDIIILSATTRFLLRFIWGIEMFKGCKIGKGIFFPHPRDIIISEGTVLGSNCTIAQGVTIGGNLQKTRIIDGIERKEPFIGDDVFIGPNSVIGGPLKIGSNTFIGANSTITKDMPSNVIAYGRNDISSRKGKYISHQGKFI